MPSQDPYDQLVAKENIISAFMPKIRASSSILRAPYACILPATPNPVYRMSVRDAGVRLPSFAMLLSRVEVEVVVKQAIISSIAVRRKELQG